VRLTHSITMSKHFTYCQLAGHGWIEEELDRAFAKSEAVLLQGLSLLPVLHELRTRSWPNHRPGKEEVLLTFRRGALPAGARRITLQSATVNAHNERFKGTGIVEVRPGCKYLRPRPGIYHVPVLGP
jgi:hypothetical protein